MFVEKSHRQGAATTVNRPRRLEPDPFGHGSTAAIARTRIARRFYCDVLRGHEAWDAELREPAAADAGKWAGQGLDGQGLGARVLRARLARQVRPA